jgi:hypothetical protein
MMCHKTWRLLAAAALVSGAAAGDYQGDGIEADLTLSEEGAAEAVTAGHTNATLTEWVLFNVAVRLVSQPVPFYSETQGEVRVRN